MLADIFISIYLHIYIYIYIYISIYIYIYIMAYRMYINIYMDIHIFMHILYIHTYIYIIQCTYVHVYECMYHKLWRSISIVTVMLNSSDGCVTVVSIQEGEEMKQRSRERWVHKDRPATYLGFGPKHCRPSTLCRRYSLQHASNLTRTEEGGVHSLV
jgi:hypothetical protein